MTMPNRANVALMRTTIDLRPELHQKALSIARDTRRSLSDTVNDLLARVLEPAEQPTTSISAATGLPLVRLGHTVTADHVSAVDDG